MVEMFMLIIEGCVENNLILHFTDKEILAVCSSFICSRSMWAFLQMVAAKALFIRRIYKYAVILLKNFSFQQLCEGETV